MRHAFGISVPAPSSTLLRFLRSQTEDVCFFTTNSGANACQRPRHWPSKASYNSLPGSRRHLNTTRSRQAVVQSSHVGHDNPRSLSRRERQTNAPNAPTSTNRLWPCVSSGNESSSPTARYASTDSRPFLRKIWGRRTADAGVQPDGPPPLPSFLDDANGTTLGRSKAGKGTNELKLRCTEFNEDGKVTLVNGEFKKTELIAKVCPVSIQGCCC